VCTDRGRFHAALARLGKTPMREEVELDLLLGRRYEDRQIQQQQQQQQHHQRESDRKTNTTRQHSEKHPPKKRRGGGRHLNQNELPNRVLLYQVNQIHDRRTRKELSIDVARYLNVRASSLPPIASYEQTKARAIDICRGDEHEEARRVLAEHGADARVWIREYFSKHPSVSVVESRSFHRILDGWGIDPCWNTTVA